VPADATTIAHLFRIPSTYVAVVLTALIVWQIRSAAIDRDEIVAPVSPSAWWADEAIVALAGVAALLLVLALSLALHTT
jgi:uncharacterized iron-regulated membrane protein